ALGPADAVGGDVTRDETHDVVDGQRVIHHAAGAVDVEVDVLVALHALQVKHLHDAARGADVIDFADEEDHPVFEQHFLEGHFAIAVVAGPAGAGHGNGHRHGACGWLGTKTAAAPIEASAVRLRCRLLCAILHCAGEEAWI